MEENKSFDEFYTKLIDIVNACHNLGDLIPKHKVLNKGLRSHTKEFQTKVTFIEEHQDLNTYKFQDLVCNLQTFEVGLGHTEKQNKVSKNKVLRFQAPKRMYRLMKLTIK